jgi:hypothetical protein
MELLRLDPTVLLILHEDYSDCFDQVLAEHRLREARTQEYFKDLKDHYDAEDKKMSEDTGLKVPDDDLLEQTFQMPTPTVFQDRQTYFLILQLAKNIENAIDQLTLERPKVTFGTLFTESFNACAIYLRESNEHLIVFEMHLFFFLNRMTKILASCLVLEGLQGEQFKFSIRPEQMKANINSNPDIQLGFNELMAAFILDNEITSVPVTVLPYQLHSIHGIMLTSVESFVMGHEYGHVLKKHAINSNSEALFINQSLAIKSNPNWEQEFEADKIGIVLSTIAQSQFQLGTDFSLLGAGIYFSLESIIGEAMQIKHNTRALDQSQVSHPPSKERLERVIKVLAAEFSEEQLLEASFLSDSIIQVIEYLWLGCKPIIQSGAQKT